ncbi:Uncharacterized protein Adt_05362 [Abeliophyllum distichum]|uniref:Uncharacterized protein n=1 Tax=Abeliophyllum distichum TaxID=126358 RepID=A0ABD1V4A1_9LAMI
MFNRLVTVMDNQSTDIYRAPQITFIKEDEAGVPLCDALVRTVVARNGLGFMLVDNILFSTFDEIDVNHELMATSEPLFSFTGDSLIPKRRITTAVDFGEPPCHLKKFMEFLVVDTCSAYHKVLGRLALKDLHQSSIA